MLYHSTTKEIADTILRTGFIDGEPTLLPLVERRGVFVSDKPMPRRPGDVVLAIQWDGAEGGLAPYTHNVRVWPPNGNDYREWLVPAERLNQCWVSTNR